MNYIKHLNAIFRRFSADQDLNPTHISLYMALFQVWNWSHFSRVIFINREEVMSLSKIGSRTTYQKCLRHLHKRKYIDYLPSNNPFKNSQVKLTIFGSGTEQSTEQGIGPSSEESSEHTQGTEVDRALVSNKNYLKQSKTSINLPKAKQEVIDFFIEQKWPEREAIKFYNHYSAVGWKIGGRIKIQDWKAAAENWVLRAAEDNDPNRKLKSAKEDYLKITKSENYGKPL